MRAFFWTTCFRLRKRLPTSLWTSSRTTRPACWSPSSPAPTASPTCFTGSWTPNIHATILNSRGREKWGILDSGQETDRLLEEIRQKLMAFRDPDTQQPVVQHVYLSKEIFHGSYVSAAADLQVDFRDGYRTSWQTSLGAIP